MAQSDKRQHERFPSELADKPVGEWNRMYIRMVGPYVTVNLNGKKVTDNVVLENYFDPKTPVPARGPIYLQTHTTKLYFRNIFVREIKPKEANKILDKIGGKSADFKPIFNGKDLAGWTGATDAYEIKGDTLVAKKGLSVRETEALVRSMLARASGGSAPRVEKGLDPNVQRLQDELSEKLGAPVQIQHSGKGAGKVVVSYHSLDELDGILAHIR